MAKEDLLSSSSSSEELSNSVWSEDNPSEQAEEVTQREAEAAEASNATMATATMADAEEEDDDAEDMDDDEDDEDEAESVTPLTCVKTDTRLWDQPKLDMFEREDYGQVELKEEPTIREMVKIAPPFLLSLKDKHYYQSEDPEDDIFQVDTRYVPQRLHKRGDYGRVAFAWDQLTKTYVAIKKVDYSRRHSSYSLLSSVKTRDEYVSYLNTHAPSSRQFREEFDRQRQLKHPFIARVTDVMRQVEPKQKFITFYVVTEKEHTNVDFVANSVASGTLGSNEIRLYFNQILRALKYLHSGNMVHRDLKLCNILVDKDMRRIKLCDMVVGPLIPAWNIKQAWSPDDCACYYMAPELLACNARYGPPVDVWAAGIVLLCFLAGDYPFVEEKPYNMLSSMSMFMERPTPEECDELYDDRGSRHIISFCLPDCTGRIQDYVGPEIAGKDKLAMDLVEKMLKFDPRERITVDEALKHPYMMGITPEVLRKELGLTQEEVDILKDENPWKLTPEQRHEIRDMKYRVRTFPNVIRSLNFRVGKAPVLDSMNFLE